MKKSKFVICIDNSEYPASLEIRKIYETLADAEAAQIGQIRVIDESGEDYLYPEACFIDAKFWPRSSRPHNQCEQYAQQAAPDGQTAARFVRRCHRRYVST